MKTHLLYQLILVCSLMVCKSYCTPSTEFEPDLQDGISSNNEDTLTFDFTVYRYIPLNKDYPYHVAIIMKIDSIVLCQGALIGSRWMLTSGICFNKYYKSMGDLLEVVAGALDTRDTYATKTRILRGIFHPKFNSKTGANDIVLIELIQDIANMVDSEERRGFVDTIKLTTHEYPPGARCVYSSFEDENLLYGYSLQLMDPSDCKGEPDITDQVLNYSCTGIGKNQFITNTTFDAQHTHIGTPLVCDGQLYGIKTEDGIFTNMREIKDWAETVIKENQ